MKDQDHNQLYGGLLARSTSEDTVPALDSQQAPRVRKATRKKTSSEDDTPKTGKRGRPRVDPTDQSAAERRRTQIRLAQRAYRERKETTISALEQRVSALVDTISEMNKIFLDYNTKAISSGIVGVNPSLGLELQETTNRFLQLARNAKLDSNINETEEIPRGTSHESNQDDDTTNPGQPVFVSSVSQLELLHQYSPPETTAMLGYEVSYDEVPLSDTGTNNDAQQLIANQDYSINHGWKDPNWQQLDLESYNMEGSPQYSNSTTDSISNMPPSIPDSLQSPYTYSFQETTFARRLFRSSYEKAYRIITDPSASQESIHYRLRFSFCYTNLQSITSRIRQVLTRTRHQNLENWEAPILHNGGAGLHYPRGGLDSETDPAPMNWRERRLSKAPRRFGVAQTREADQLEVDEFPKFANCEGIWFDSNDVEQYLRTKGLYLDGQSSLAEIEVDNPSPLISLPPGTATDSPYNCLTDNLDSPASPRDQALNLNRFPGNDSDPYFFDMNTSSSAWLAGGLPDFNATHESINLALDCNNSANGNAKSNPNPTIYLPSQHALSTNANTNMAIFPTYPPRSLPSRKRKLTIDVDKLLELLNSHSVCMGRAPGYRKENVDMAFWQALREAEAF